MVLVTCYGKAKTYRRADAIEFFSQGVMECDGSEAERYATIVAQLLAGYREVTDEWDF